MVGYKMLKQIPMLNQDIEILHSQKKEMTDKLTGKQIVYYELTSLIPKLYEGTTVITSGEDIKPSKIKRDILITATDKGLLKLRIIKSEMPVAPALK